MIEGQSFDEIFQELVFNLQHNPPYISSPRGQKVKEALVVTLKLTNPRARLLSCKARKADYGFAAGEFMWYWTGRRDLESLLYYNKRADQFSNDRETVNSAYGYRLRQRSFFASLDKDVFGSGGTQWQTCVNTLEKDPDSRRAVMVINMPEDEREADFCGSKDVPCTMSLQFFVRDNKLDLHVLMRSNDIMWGLTYDLFSFTLFQECMLLDLKKLPQFENLELGTYYHTAGSMHMYERHFEMADQVIADYSLKGLEVPPMEPLKSLWDLNVVRDIERRLRENGVYDDVSRGRISGAAGWLADRLLDHRLKRDRQALGGKE